MSPRPAVRILGPRAVYQNLGGTTLGRKGAQSGDIPPALSLSLFKSSFIEV